MMEAASVGPDEMRKVVLPKFCPAYEISDSGTRLIDEGDCFPAGEILFVGRPRVMHLVDNLARVKVVEILRDHPGYYLRLSDLGENPWAEHGNLR